VYHFFLALVLLTDATAHKLMIKRAVYVSVEVTILC